MTKRRCVIALLVLVGGIGLAIVVIGLLPDRPGVTRRNFARIVEGMTRAEVEEIFRQPANEPLPPIMVIARSHFWLQDDGFAGAFVTFDDDGRVISKEWRDNSFWGRVRLVLPFL